MMRWSKSKHPSRRPWLAAWVAIAMPCAIRAEEPTPLDFAKDIRPILAAHCIECHGPAKREAGPTLCQPMVDKRFGETKIPNSNSKYT